MVMKCILLSTATSKSHPLKHVKHKAQSPRIVSFLHIRSHTCRTLLWSLYTVTSYQKPIRKLSFTEQKCLGMERWQFSLIISINLQSFKIAYYKLLLKMICNSCYCLPPLPPWEALKFLLNFFLLEISLSLLSSLSSKPTSLVKNEKKKRGRIDPCRPKALSFQIGKQPHLFHLH